MDRPTRLLTIDDDAGIRELFARILRGHGYEVLEATDGEHGLEVFRRERPAAVLSDLRMPRLDGLEVLSAIAAESPETPVIIISGAGQREDAVRALQLGAADYLVKPLVAVDELVRSVQGVLERAALRREVRAYRERLERQNRELALALSRLQADEEAARRLQLQLLPPDGWRAGEYALSRRLRASEYLSGDFVDYFSLDAKRVGLFLVDVAGHGAASALVTVMLRTLMRRYREALRDGDETILAPERALDRLDRDLRAAGIAQHATAFFGVLDTVDHRLAYASAGHFPAPLLRVGGDVAALPCRGRPLALFEGGGRAVHAVGWPPGAALVVASDGVLEHLPGGATDAKLAALRDHFRQASAIDDLAASLGLDDDRVLPDDVALLWLARDDP